MTDQKAPVSAPSEGHHANSKAVHNSSEWGEPLLSLPDVCRFTNVCPATIYGLIRNGKFPKPLKFGGASRWEPELVRNCIRQMRQSAV